jgi:integrase
MGRKVKDTTLDTREARRKLKLRHEPYWRLIDAGLHLGYRKGPRGGIWLARLARGGAYKKKALGSANDILDADADTVLDFSQAQKKVEDGYVHDDNAWRKVRPFENTDQGQIRFLKTEECIRLVNACPPDLRALVRGALYTGARFGELARLTVAEVHTADNRIYISPAAKSGHGRYVPLNAEATQFFADLISGKTGATVVFTRTGGAAWGKNHHVRSFEKANKVAKIKPEIGFHDLRHSYATAFANADGNTIDMLAKILGHADTRITKKHYAHLFDDTLRAAVAKLPSLGYVSTGEVVGLRPKQAA